MNAFRTYELPITEYPELPEQKEWVQNITLLYLATRDYPVNVKRGVSIVKSDSLITPEVEKEIFTFLKLDYNNRSSYKDIIDTLGELGSKSSTHYYTYLFSNKPNRTPSSGKEDDSKLMGKHKLLGYVDNGLLPFAVLPTVTARIVLGLVAQKIKGHVENNNNTVKNKQEALNVSIGKETLLSWGQRVDKEKPEYNGVFSFAQENEQLGYLVRYSKRRNLPPEIAEEFAKFNVELSVLKTYLKYRRAISLPDYSSFSYDPNIECPEFNDVYFKLLSIQKIYNGCIFNVDINGKQHVINTGLSAKCLNPIFACKKYEKTTKSGEKKFERSWFINYTENNKERTLREGRIKHIRKVGDSLRITFEVELPSVNGYDSKLINSVRAYFSTAYGSKQKESKERANIIPEGFRFIGFDIGAYRPISYSVHELSFTKVSEVKVNLDDGRVAYIHRLDCGNIGSKTEVYDKFQDLASVIYALEKEIKENKKNVDNQLRHDLHTKLTDVQKKMREVNRNSTNSFATKLLGDQYKYLDLTDRILRVRRSIDTMGKTTEEAIKINKTGYKKAIERRQYIRRDYNRKILHEICRLCRQWNIGIAIVEDFDYEREDENKAKRKMASLLKMRGFKKMIEEKLQSELNVLVAAVNPDYTSQTYYNGSEVIWGHRKDRFLYPYHDDTFGDPVDSDTNAAQNLVLRFLFRQTDILTFTAVAGNQGKVKMSEYDEEENKNLRRRGAVQYHFGLSIKELPEFNCDEPLKYRYQKVYRFVNKPQYVTTRKMRDVLEEKFKSKLLLSEAK